MHDVFTARPPRKPLWVCFRVSLPDLGILSCFSDRVYFSPERTLGCKAQVSALPSALNLGETPDQSSSICCFCRQALAPALASRA